MAADNGIRKALKIPVVHWIQPLGERLWFCLPVFAKGWFARKGPAHAALMPFGRWPGAALGAICAALSRSKSTHFTIFYRQCLLVALVFSLVAMVDGVNYAGSD